MEKGKDCEEIFEYDGSSDDQAGNVGKGYTFVSKGLSSATPETEVAISIDSLQTVAVMRQFQQNEATSYEDAGWSAAGRMEQTKGLETPWQRFLRLQSEWKELQTDLTLLQEAENSDKASILAYLQAETEKSGHELRKLESDGRLQGKNDPAAAAMLENLANQVSSFAIASPSSEGIMIRPSEVLLQIEQRIAKLETQLGSNTNLTDLQQSLYPENVLNPQSIGTSRPIVQVVRQLEERLALLDPKTIDTIKTKIKLLRSDLEALTGGGNNLPSHAGKSFVSSGSGATEIKIFEAAKKIETVALKLAQVESVAEDLPVIVARMKTLESVHMQASTVTSRVQTLEQQARELKQAVKSNGDVIAALRDGLAQNLVIIQANIQQVEARMDKLAK